MEESQNIMKKLILSKRRRAHDHDENGKTSQKVLKTNLLEFLIFLSVSVCHGWDIDRGLWTGLNCGYPLPPTPTPSLHFALSKTREELLIHVENWYTCKTYILIYNRGFMIG